jgi:pilus assembly protein Flp/PilA
MSTFINRVKRFVGKDDQGAGLSEYGLLVGMIAVIVLGAVTTLGSTIGSFFNNINAAF